jgi:hypothetical protein
MGPSWSAARAAWQRSLPRRLKCGAVECQARRRRRRRLRGLRRGGGADRGAPRLRLGANDRARVCIRLRRGAGGVRVWDRVAGLSRPVWQVWRLFAGWWFAATVCLSLPLVQVCRRERGSERGSEGGSSK